MIDTLLTFLPLLGAAAVIVLAQTQVKDRSERASLFLSAGAGVEILFTLARHFWAHELLWMAGPLVHAGALGAVTYGLMILVDELNPKLGGLLPGALATHKEAAPNTFQRYFFGAFGVLGILGTGLQHSLPLAGASLLALGGVLWGSLWLERQGPLGKWVLERRPDQVVWSYVYQLKVVNRQTGSTSVHWSAQVGLSTGALVPLPADGELHAQHLVAAVRERCPQALLGFSAENAARFKSTPQAMRAPG